MLRSSYRGRFAPSPTGLLHAGSLVTALASWLDAKAAIGTWLIRIEDIDTPRIQPHATEGILQQLALFGMLSDEKIVYQSERLGAYETALMKLNQSHRLYVCTCSRKKIIESRPNSTLQGSEAVYPGFCRPEKDQNCSFTSPTGAIRIKIPKNTIVQNQDLNQEVGDFVLKRNDGIFSYQLAVVVDDDFQKITHIVRGQDLESNTPRQQWLQQQLQLPSPKYLHIPLILNDAGEKLSKQTKAPVIWPSNKSEVLHYLHLAGEHLGLGLAKPNSRMTLCEWQEQAIQAWRNLSKSF